MAEVTAMGSKQRTDKIRVAFVRIGGLSAGGTERWLQMMAASLPRDRFDITYFYSANPPHLGARTPPVPADPYRKKFMEDAGVKLVEVKIAAKDPYTPTHPWVNTDFWSQFDECQFDIVQTAKSGPAEYPFHMMRLPVVEYVVLGAGVDFSSNIACTVHASQWQRRRWVEEGGKIEKSVVIPIPANEPATDRNIRKELDIPQSALVAGFHQQVSDAIYSELPLAAFSLIEQPRFYFAILGGSEKYLHQAKKLGLRNIRFVPHTGNSESISAFLNTLDIFTHGRFDGEVFGAVLAEAMIHGKPCMSHLSTIANAQSETIGPGGFVVDGAAAYAQGILRLFDDSKLRMQLGDAARRHALRYYSLESAANRLAQIYEHVVSRPRGAITHQSTLSPLTYGISDLGCLYPGMFEDPKSVSRHVLVGGVPEPFNVHIFDYFVQEIRTLIDMTENSAIFAPRLLATGSRDAKAIVLKNASEFVRTLPSLVELNNWQGRVGLLESAFENKVRITFSHATVPDQADVDSHDTAALSGLDCLRLGIDPAGSALPKLLDDWILQFRPVVCIEPATDEQANRSILRRLRELDYLVIQKSLRRDRLRILASCRVATTSATLWCLPQERYAKEVLAIFDWAHRFKHPSSLGRQLKVVKSRLKHAARVSRILAPGISMLRRGRSDLIARMR
jgi:hypothetical protein